MINSRYADSILLFGNTDEEGKQRLNELKVVCTIHKVDIDVHKRGKNTYKLGNIEI